MYHALMSLILFRGLDQQGLDPFGMALLCQPSKSQSQNFDEFQTERQAVAKASWYMRKGLPDNGCWTHGEHKKPCNDEQDVV